MSTRTKETAATIAAIVIIVLAGTILQYVLDIDNAQTRYVRVEASAAIARDDGSFDYTLASYDDAGGRDVITFGADKNLRDGAYLELSVMPLRGVVSWQEVETADMPAKTREALGA